MTRKILRAIKNAGEFDVVEFFGPLGLIAGWVCAIGCLVGVVTHGLQAVKAAVAPRVVLIEKVGELVGVRR